MSAAIATFSQAGRTQRPTRAARLLAAQAFATLLGLRLALITRDTLVLERAPVAWFPYIYGATALVMLAVVGLAGPFVRSGSPRRVALTWLPVSAAGLVGCGLVGSFEPESRAGRLALHGGAYVFVELVEAFAMLAYWSLASRHVTTREAKTVFPVLVASGTLGVMAAGGLQLGLTGSLPQQHVYGVAALAMGISAGLAARLDPGPEAPLREQVPSTSIEMDQYAWMLAVVVFTSVGLKTLVGLVFKTQVALTEPDEASMAGFFARFHLVTSGLQLSLQLLVTGWLLRRFGVAKSMLIYPAGMAASMAYGIASPSGTAVSLAKGTERILGISVQQPVLQAMMGPVADAQQVGLRTRLQAQIPQAATLIAVLLCLIYARIQDPSLLFGAGAFFVAAWLGAALSLQRGYRIKVAERLRAGRIDPLGSGTTLVDADYVNAARKALTSGRPRAVRGALRLMAEGTLSYPSSLLTSLLSNGSPRLRAEILEVLPPELDAASLERVQLLLDDPEAQVRAAAVRCLGRVPAGPSAPDLSPMLLEDPALEVRSEAMVAFWRLHRGVPPPSVHGRWTDWVQSPAPRERSAAARVLAASANGHTDTLAVLLEDPEASVRRTAAESAYIRGFEASLFEPLCRALMRPETVVSAKAVLATPEALPRLAQILEDPGQPLGMRVQGLDVLRQMATPESGERLVDRLERERDEWLFDAALAAAGRMRQDAPDVPLPAERLRARLRELAALAKRTRVLQSELWAQPDATPEWEELSRSVLQALARRKASLVGLSALLHPQRDLRWVSTGLESDDPRKRAHALELIEEVLPERLASSIVPLYETRRPGPTRPPSRPSSSGWPQACLDDPDPWIRATAARWILRHGDSREPAVARLLTAMQSSKLDFERESASFEGPGESVRPGPDSVSSLVVYLRGVDLFRTLSGSELAMIAREGQVREYGPGEVLLRQGDPADSVHIMLGGQVLVTSDGARISSCGPGEMLGEMGVLERLPRSATVSAEGSVTTLHIDGDKFRQLMLLLPALAESIIHTLSQRLRQAPQNRAFDTVRSDVETGGDSTG